MNTYVCLPKHLYSKLDTKKFTKDFRKNLDPYFSSYELHIYADHEASKPQVIFMDDAKPGYNKEIIVKKVVPFFKKYFNDEKLDIEIKLNYSKFNPNYVPKIKNVNSKVENKMKNYDNGTISEFDYDKLSLNYSALEPRYSFEQVVLPEKVLESINNAIGIISVEHKVFDEWGLRNIIPENGAVLNFYGPPGTGKSMTAEAVAKKLKKKIIKATYADIESKYHGEGPKMVKAIFKAAERENAVLFLDEADSLLSKRLTNVTDGSAQAINSMRSQLLISLENHKGLVIFASNLVINYDKAFLSRLINIEFTEPSAQERAKIWSNHLKTDKVKVPLSNDVNIKFLAKKYKFNGREIKNSIKDACVKAALDGKDFVCQKDFVFACNNVENERNNVSLSQDYTRTIKLSEKQKETIKKSLQKRIDKKIK